MQNSMPKISLKGVLYAGLCITLCMFIHSSTFANHITISVPTVDLVVEAYADAFCDGDNETEDISANTPNAQFPGADFGIYRHASALDKAKTCDGSDVDHGHGDGDGIEDIFECQLTSTSRASANAIARAEVKGQNSHVVDFNWQQQAQTRAHITKNDCCFWCPSSCDEGYTATATSNLTFDFKLKIHAPSGQAILNFNASRSITEINTPEAGTEDDAQVQIHTFFIDGVPVQPNTPMDMSVANHQEVHVRIVSEVSATINSPGQGALCFIHDHANAQAAGAISFHLAQTPTTLGPPVLLNPSLFPTPYSAGPTCGMECSFPLFSLDIGSDKELSDPAPSSDEFFDPGDMYADMGTVPVLGGEDGLLDDEDIFVGLDFAPSTPDPNFPPLSAAPVGQFPAIPDYDKDYFDLDGSDNLSFSLLNTPYGPGSPSIHIPFTPCLYEPEFLLISFDDDREPHYMFDHTSSVPVNEASTNNLTYGQSGQNDEVVAWDMMLSPYGSPNLVGNEFGISDEEWLHSQLAPNPDPFNQQDDDDVDALDMPIATAGCDIWYFSADHEAPGIDPNSHSAFHPGTIYEVTPAGPVPVVEPTLHLGISDQADIDAFEFVSIWDPAEFRRGVALLFSVDSDDPLTVLDESGGLDPAVLYYSFLNGSFDIFVDNASEDIDAIAASYCELTQDAIVGNTVPRLYIKQRSFDVGSSAQVIDVLIGNSAPQTVLNWNAVSTAPWITTYTASGGSGPGILTIILDENNSGSSRNGTIEITSNGSCPALDIEIYQGDAPKRGVGFVNELSVAKLLTPQPHPIKELTQFAFIMEESANITLAVYDLSGRRVSIVAEGQFSAGEHRMDWNAKDAQGRSLSSGIYELRLELADGGIDATQRRMISIVR